MLFEVGCRQQRELVEGQRPGRRRGDGERDRADAAALGLGEQASEGVAVGGAAKGEHTGKRWPGQGAARDRERVVGDLRAVAGPSQVGVGVDRGELAEGEAGRGGLGDRGELEVMGAAGVERLGDRERAVPELGLGCEQLEVDQVAGERSQREQRLQPGHAAAGDQNTQTAVALRALGFRHPASLAVTLRLRIRKRSYPAAGYPHHAGEQAKERAAAPFT